MFAIRARNRLVLKAADFTCKGILHIRKGLKYFSNKFSLHIP